MVGCGDCQVDVFFIASVKLELEDVGGRVDLLAELGRFLEPLCVSVEEGDSAAALLNKGDGYLPSNTYHDGQVRLRGQKNSESFHQVLLVPCSRLRGVMLVSMMTYPMPHRSRERIQGIGPCFTGTISKRELIEIEFLVGLVGARCVADGYKIGCQKQEKKRK